MTLCVLSITRKASVFFTEKPKTKPRRERSRSWVLWGQRGVLSGDDVRQKSIEDEKQNLGVIVEVLGFVGVRFYLSLFQEGLSERKVIIAHALGQVKTG